MDKLCILGGGSWGTALAIALSSRFQSIFVWSRYRERAAAIELMRENTYYLPGFLIPSNVSISADLEPCLTGASVVLLVTPAQALRTVVREIQPFLAVDATIVCASKGIEEETLYRMSEVVRQELGESLPLATLSGPTFARGIAAGEPAAMVIASEELAIAESIQRRFATPELRLYASIDVAGVEYGAALKNVVALGAGLCGGLGLGNNSIAALITRGLAEISRFATWFGGQPKTLSGLAGLGDLILTATGEESRNRKVGVALGQGHSLQSILDRMQTVAEGVATCRAAYHLAIRHQIETPIIRAVYQVLYEGKSPRLTIRDLMDRPLRVE
jgi:glycerol-3-phosphate dehydrogenase (NAD(P)+)